MTQRLLKHKLLIGAVTLLAAGSAGGAYAATESGTNPRQAFLNDVAKRLNVTPSRLRAAVRGAMLDRLEAAVKAGQLTQAQADRIQRRIEQGGGLTLGLRRFGPPGLLAPRPLMRLRAHRGGPLGAAAHYLGLSDQQLLRDVMSGKSLAQVAQARGKSVSGLEQAMAAAMKTRLDKAVSAGMITQAQEQRMLNRLRRLIDRLANGTQPPTRPIAPVPGPAAAPPPGPPPPGA